MLFVLKEAILLCVISSNCFMSNYFEGQIWDYLTSPNLLSHTLNECLLFKQIFFKDYFIQKLIRLLFICKCYKIIVVFLQKRKKKYKMLTNSCFHTKNPIQNFKPFPTSIFPHQSYQSRTRTITLNFERGRIGSEGGGA